MEQDNGTEGVIDLSNTMNESSDRNIYDGPEAQAEDARNIPVLYRMMIKISHGIIKTEGQAKAVAILIIIAANVVTFSLLFKGSSNSVSEETIPATSQMP